MIRYPLALDEHEESFDHLTDDEEHARALAHSDPIGISGAELAARDPSLGNMLIPAYVLFAFAVAGLLAYLT